GGPSELDAAFGRDGDWSVERMAPLADGVELIVGVRRDPRFGPILLAGLGGVYAEALRDVAVALAPVEPGPAEHLRRSLRAPAMPRPRAVFFDFNGTLSDDEPILARVYQEQFAELGKPITEAEYYEQLAGHTDEEMFTRWFGHADPALIADRIARYNRLVADG